MFSMNFQIIHLAIKNSIVLFFQLADITLQIIISSKSKYLIKVKAVCIMQML